MGWPLTTVAMPLVLLPSGKLPAIVTDDDTGHSWLCEKGLQLKSRAFSLKRGNTTSYCNLAILFNKQGTGILQQILPLEEEVMHRGEEALTEFRKSPKNAKVMESYYDWVDAYLTDRYREIFNVE